jgi:hypothetical protein
VDATAEDGTVTGNNTVRCSAVLGSAREWFRYFQDQLDSVFVSRIFISAYLAGFAVLLGLAYQIFVAPSCRFGGSRWFSRSREAQSIPAIGQVFSPFAADSI